MPGQEPAHLFVCGTLMDPKRVEALTGKRFAPIDATLPEFERGESRRRYPYVLPNRGTIVHGLLLTNVDSYSFCLLDAYEAEGDLYRRQVVEVLVAGASVLAMTYVGGGIGASAAEAVAWSSEVDLTPAGQKVMSSPDCPAKLS